MHKQILLNFTIAKSPNLSFSKMPGGSFSVIHSPYDLKQTQILGIERIKSDNLIVKIKISEGDMRNGYIRAKNKVGEQELNIIEKQATEFINKSYDTLVYFAFKRI